MSVLSIKFVLICVSLAGYVSAHMGISSPVAREKATVGDAYRYPNAGHCHGVGPGNSAVTYAAGQTVTLTLSGGAAHNGGHCALFLARKSDDEQVWFKQMDIIDCTTMASFTWTINAGLVPSSCSDGGCALIWGWTPTSSGACEIYMNCFDVTITGATGGTAPSAITVNKNPACSRVDANTKKTAHFGTWCGTECGEMMPPTAAGATKPPTVPAMTLPNRCGSSWVDANSNCRLKGNGCSVAADCEEVGLDCYADMMIPCTGATGAPTLAGVTPPPTMANAPAPTMATASSNCRSIGAYASIVGMTQWCVAACESGIASACPASHCSCEADATFFRSTNVVAYVPSCQTTTTTGTKTIKQIAEDYDLSSYEPDPADANALNNAASALLTYNKQCKPELADATIDTTPASGITLFITGDCQLTDVCKPGSNVDDDDAAANRLSALPVMFLFALMFIGYRLL